MNFWIFKDDRSGAQAVNLDQVKRIIFERDQEHSPIGDITSARLMFQHPDSQEVTLRGKDAARLFRLLGESSHKPLVVRLVKYDDE